MLVIIFCSIILEEEEEENDPNLSDYTALLANGEPSWSIENPLDLLRFDVKISFNIPDIVINPTLKSIQEGVNQVAMAIVGVSRGVMWWAADVNETFHNSVSKDEVVMIILKELAVAVTSESTVSPPVLPMVRSVKTFMLIVYIVQYSIAMHSSGIP